jgi:hypothetical protein
MNVVHAKALELEAAAKTVEGARFYRDLGTTMDPPALVIGPPRLQWEGYGGEPTSATFIVIVMVDMNERAQEALWDLVPLVSEAMSGVDDAVVMSATPGVFNANGTDLPSYEMNLEVAL